MAGTKTVEEGIRVTDEPAVTGEPTGMGGSSAEQLEAAFQIYRDVNEGKAPAAMVTVADNIIQNVMQGAQTQTTTQAYNIADEEASRVYNKYMGELQAGNLQLSEALAGIQRETGVTDRAETMGQEQRAFWDMQLAPGTEYQPGFEPESAIGELRQQRGAGYESRPVTQVPTAALSPQSYLQQAQQSFPEVPQVNIPPYPQMPMPSGMGETATTTTNYVGGFNQDKFMEAYNRVFGGGAAATGMHPTATPSEGRGGLPLWPWGY